MEPRFKIGDLITVEDTELVVLAIVTAVATEAKRYTLRHCTENDFVKDYAFSDTDHWCRAIVTFVGPVAVK